LQKYLVTYNILLVQHLVCNLNLFQGPLRKAFWEWVETPLVSISWRVDGEGVSRVNIFPLGWVKHNLWTKNIPMSVQ
jgi:hypothetical protein